MADFKPISRDAIPLALEKAERYRLLNEPAQAESICLDVLAVDPENQRVLVLLILALTDQFQTGPTDCFRQAEALVPRLHGEYERSYYSGIIFERRGYARAVTGRARERNGGLPVDSSGDGLLRTSRTASCSRQRRRPSALE